MSGYTKECSFCHETIRLSNDTGNRWLPYNLDNSPHECRPSKNNNNKTAPPTENTTSKVKITLSLDSLDQRITKLEEMCEKRFKKIEDLLFSIE